MCSFVHLVRQATIIRRLTNLTFTLPINPSNRHLPAKLPKFPPFLSHFSHPDSRVSCHSRRANGNFAGSDADRNHHNFTHSRPRELDFRRQQSILHQQHTFFRLQNHQNLSSLDHVNQTLARFPCSLPLNGN